MNDFKIVTANPQQHVPEIKRNYRFIKDKCYGLYHQTPYQKLPKKIVISMVYLAATLENYFHAA